MSRTEDLLTHALQDRVEHRELPSTPMSEVVATAGRIRRQRRVRTAAVAAVVVAVLVVPFVVVASRASDSSPQPAGPTPTAPTRLADLSRGEPPGVPWFDGDTYVDGNGSRTTLPLRRVTTATPYRGGFLAATYDDNKLVLLDEQLDLVWRRCGIPVYAVDQAEQYTAYMTTDCDGSNGVVHVGATDGSGTEETRPAPLVGGGPVGMFGDVAVVVSSYNEGPPIQVAFDGSTWDLSRLKWANGVNEQLGMVSGRLDDAAGTGAVVDPRTGEVEWMLTGWNLASFSPDGSTVLGFRQQGAPGPATWGVFDAATGEQLHELELPISFQIVHAAWEDDDHVLFETAQDDEAWAIVRASLDGGLERATEVASYDPDGPNRYRFADRIS